jgi:ferredoxin-NADP reductase
VARAALQRRLTWRFGEVAAVVDETPRVRSLVLDVPGWPGHLSGQHVDVRLTADDGYQTERSYSIATPPDDGERLALTVERLADGEVSPYLAEELLLVAGGSGICPLMAMLRHRAAAGSAIPTRLLYSSRSLEDVIFRAELERLAATGDGLQVVHTLTRAQPSGWTGYRRRIDRDMLAEVAWPPELHPIAYVCGPTPLVESVAEALVHLGHEASRVRTERFGPTGG